MSILSDFEDRVASAVEGIFAGAFRSPVQPAEVAKAIGRAMDDGRMVGIGKVYAPSSYVVALSPADAENLRGFTTVLSGELATYVTERARESGYHLAAAPAISFVEHRDLKLGRFRVSAEHVAAAAESAAGDPERTARAAEPLHEPPAGWTAAAGTPGGAIYDHEADEESLGLAVAPGAPMDTLTVGETGHDIALRGDRMVIGRLHECDLCLEDANVSRRHAEVFQIDGDWFLQDLDSTNGTGLNGEPVSRARLRDGDVIEIGVTRLTYHRAQG